MGTLEVLKGMPGFLLPGTSGSPWGIFHEMTTPGLTWTFFLAGLGQFSLAVGHPTPVSQTYSHVPIIVFFRSVDTPPSWRVWKFPNAFTQKTLRSVNRCLIFETSFVPPYCLFTLYLNVAVLGHSVLWAAVTRSSLENACGVAEFQRRAQETWISASRLISYTFISLIYDFCRLC